MQKEIPAGFWIRFFAIVVDSLILSVLITIIGKVFLLVAISTLRWGLPVVWVVGLIQWFAAILVTFLYFDHFYRNGGASLGKKAFSLRVLNAGDSSFLSTKQVFLREIVGKILSSILAIGYLMAAFRSDKRALHDLIADSRVVRVEIAPLI